MTLTLMLALLIGIVAGLRAITAPAAVAFAARFGGLELAGTPLAFMGYTWTPWIFGVLALAELVTDQLPGTPSRKVLPQFATRIIMGGLAGGAIGAAHGFLLGGVVAGAIGAVVGTLGGAEMRARVAAAFKQDRPAAIMEDVIAIGGAILIVLAAA
jgi:uncharacterized membrane protein